MSQRARRELTASRRHFLRSGTLALGSLFGGVPGARAALAAQTSPIPDLAPFLADVNGNGRLGPSDELVVANALFTERGHRLRPRPGFDMRADVLGRGIIDQDTFNAVRRAINEQQGAQIPDRRPITVAWHYGWYNRTVRPPGTQTVQFKGGDYVSRDPDIETLFNEQKNECGITVDALSWIPEQFNANLIGNYFRGFCQAENVGSRHVALLYESTLALPTAGERIDFQNAFVQGRIEEDFSAMARFLNEIRHQATGRVFTLDGRPVVFIFGSHIWGLLPVTEDQYRALEQSIDRLREAFRAVYGTLPYLVGEEIALTASGVFARDRQRRSTNFDAIYVYHHASNLKPSTTAPTHDASLYMTPHYVENQLDILQQTYIATESLRNRYTDKPILVIPNVAPGFAKPGLPTLQVNRRDYADFIHRVRAWHDEQYIRTRWRSVLGSPQLPAPVYVVGSWNEEFEGHAVFPARFNQALYGGGQGGFEFSMAIKEGFGWNHYAERDLMA